MLSYGRSSNRWQNTLFTRRTTHGVDSESRYEALNLEIVYTPPSVKENSLLAIQGTLLSYGRHGLHVRPFDMFGWKPSLFLPLADLGLVLLDAVEKVRKCDEINFECVYFTHEAWNP